MPLNKQALIVKLTKYFSVNRNTGAEAAKDLADIIDWYVRSADVQSSGQGLIKPGDVQTEGTAAKQFNTTPVISKVSVKGKLK